MPRHGDIGEVTIHFSGGQDEGLIDGDALIFMDGGSVAVIKRGIPAGFKSQPTPLNLEERELL